MSQAQTPSTAQDKTRRDALVGTQLGPWLVERRVIEDALGAVYRVAHGDAQYALRLLPAQPLAAAPPHVTRALWADLNALRDEPVPGVLPVLEAGPRLHGLPLPYVLQPWAEGLTWRDALRSRAGRLPAEESITLARLALAALRPLFSLGLTHGALHPARIIIERADAGPRVIRLCDAGLGRVFEALALTHGGALEQCAAAVASHADYLCPQQALTGASTYLTDVYALGAILYDSLCGAPPFASPQPAVTLRRQVSEAPLPLALASPPPALPDGLQDLLDLCLAKQPAARLQSPEAVRNALLSLTPCSPQEAEGHLPDEVLPLSSLTDRAPTQPAPQPPPIAAPPTPAVEPDPSDDDDALFDAPEHVAPAAAEPDPSDDDDALFDAPEPSAAEEAPQEAPKEAPALTAPEASTSGPALDDEDAWFSEEARGPASYASLDEFAQEDAQATHRRTILIIAFVMLCVAGGLIYWVYTYEPHDPAAQSRAAAAAAAEKEAAQRKAALGPLLNDLEAALAAQDLLPTSLVPNAPPDPDDKSAATLIRALTTFTPDPLPPDQYSAHLQRVADALTAAAAAAEAAYVPIEGFVRSADLKALHAGLMGLSNAVAESLPADPDPSQRAFALAVNASLSGIWHTAQMGTIARYYTAKVHQQNLQHLQRAVDHWAAIATLPSLPAGPANAQLQRLRPLLDALQREGRAVAPRWRFIGVPSP